jgi:hypothetical protein
MTILRHFAQVVLQIILYSVLTQGQGATCPNENVTFLHFVPCWQENDGISALDRLDSCDLLARAAVDLAIERVNENLRSRAEIVGTIEFNDTINVSLIGAAQYRPDGIIEDTLFRNK